MTLDLDIDILARTIWGEARGEGMLGMEAIAHVVLNRKAVSDQLGGSWWGNAIQEICQMPYQFSCWNNDDPNRAKLMKVTPDDPLFRKALDIAEDACEGFPTPDETHGATHYYNSSILKAEPHWAYGEECRAVIRNHTFYRPKEVVALVEQRPFQTFAENPTAPYNDSVDDDNYVLAYDWDYIYEDEADGKFRKNHYKEGILYDSASVPNLLGAIGDIHPNGPLRPSALPHDLLFIYGGKNFPKGMQFVWDGEKWVDDDKEWTWTMADKLFKRINAEYGKISKWKRGLIYGVLRAGSWVAWLTDDPKDRAQIDALYN